MVGRQKNIDILIYIGRFSREKPCQKQKVHDRKHKAPEAGDGHQTDKLVQEGAMAIKATSERP